MGHLFFHPYYHLNYPRQLKGPNTMSKMLAVKNELLAPHLDYFLIDGSGSMQSQWWETLAALDNYANTLIAAHRNAHGIISVFSSGELQMIQRDSLIDTWRPFKEDPLGSTWGSTPLYDAINLMGLHLRDLAPSSCSIVIVTDGEENCSQTSLAQAKSILDWCRAHGWSVTFLGANFENSKQARLLGADASNSIGVRKELLPEAGKLLAKKRIEGKDGEFSDDEKTKFGGYLCAPTN